MNNVELLAALAEADAFAADVPLPADITPDSVLSDIAQRTSVAQVGGRGWHAGRPSSGRAQGMLVAVGAFAVVILLGFVIWATTARNAEVDVVDTPTPTTPTSLVDPVTYAADLAFIERHLESFWETGDFEQALADMGLTPRDGDGTNVSEILYQAAIETDVSLIECMPVDRPRLYECTIGYSNMLFRAVGEPPFITIARFDIIRDGLLNPMGEVRPEPNDNVVNDAWFAYERHANIVVGSSCRPWGSNSQSCSALQREHLDAFALWWDQNR